MPKLRRILIEAAPQHEPMRYETVGDWYHDDDGLVIKVRCADPFFQDDAFLIALHELVEAKLCWNRNISQTEVDDFDTRFEGEDEPGDQPAAPYGKEHRFAMLVEHLMAHELGLRRYGKVE